MADYTIGYVGDDRSMCRIPERQFDHLPEGHEARGICGSAHTQAVMDGDGACVGWGFVEHLGGEMIGEAWRELVTDANGRPFPKPGPPGHGASLDAKLAYVRACHAYNDAVADYANKSFVSRFAREIRK